MTTSLSSVQSSPAIVVTSCLDAVARKDVAAAMALVDHDVVYRNVSLPAGRGGLLRGLAGAAVPALRAPLPRIAPQ